MKECKLPTRRQCFELMEEFHVPLHIRKHGQAVARLGVFLAKRLQEKGIAVNLKLVDRACLLHDLLRICDLYESGGYDRSRRAITDADRARWQQLRARYRNLCHEDAAFAVLTDEYPELALAIKRHRYAALLDEKDKPATWEEKLVYYADKRVMHAKIVPLKERLDEAHRRNALQRSSADQAKLNTARIDAAIFELERQIFAQIGLGPDDVTAGRNISRTRKSSGTHVT